MRLYPEKEHRGKRGVTIFSVSQHSAALFRKIKTKPVKKAHIFYNIDKIAQIVTIWAVFVLTVINKSAILALLVQNASKMRVKKT